MSNYHAVVSGHIWIFNFDKLEWFMLPSLNMLRPTYFHASAINQVKSSFFVRFNLFII